LTLAASTTTSGADIQWYDGATYLTTGTSYAPTLSSTKTYTVKSHLNGCYSSDRTATGTINPIPNAPVANDIFRCDGGAVTLTATCSTSGATIKWYDGSTYLADGTSYGDLLTATKSYNVKSYLNGCYSLADAVTAEIRTIPTVPNATGASRCGSGSISLSATPVTAGSEVKWYDGTTLLQTGNTYAPNVTATKTYTVKAHLNSCYSTARDVTATVKTVPANPVGVSGENCGTGTVSLSASTTTSGATIQWYDGITYLTSGNSYTTSNLASTKSYISKAYLDGCYSADVNVTATIKTVPNTPTTVGDAICGTGLVPLSATTTTSGASIVWYQGSTQVATGATYTPSVSSTTTYSVKSLLSGCYSSATNVTATVKPLPEAPVSSGNWRCGTGTLSLTATCATSGAAIQWYDGATLKNTGTTYTTPSLSADKTYTLISEKDGCQSLTNGSSLADIRVVPANPVATDVARCSSGTVSLSATCATSGATIKWYNGTTFLADGTSYDDLISTTQSYNVKSYLNGCYSSSADVATATVNALPNANAGADQSVCSGSSKTLTGTGGTSYLWSPATGLSSTTAASPTASPTATTTYTVTVTDANGCSKSDNVVITVNALPSASIAVSETSGLTNNDGTTCSGASLTLTASGGATYLWSTGQSTSSAVFSPTTTTAYTVTVTDANLCASSATRNITVNALPTPTFTAQATSVCNNSTGNVYTTQASKSSYVWVIPAGGTVTSGGTSTSNTATVTWTTAGSKALTVKYTDANGCTAAAPATSNVTVNALPTPTFTAQATSVCNNSTGNVYTTQASKSSYVWVIPAGGTVTSGGTTTSNTATITWGSSGSKALTVNYTDANGCTAAAPATSNVTVNALPIPTFTAQATSVCNNSTGNVYTTQTSKSSYVWVIPAGGTVTSGGTSTSNTATITWGSSGSKALTVNYTDANGCTAAAPATSNVTVNALPIPTFTAQATSVCNNSTGNVYTTQASKSSYVWVIPAGGTVTSGGTTTSNTATITWGSSGSKALTVNYTDANGCTAAAPATSNVTVNALPIPTFTAQATSVCNNSTGNVYTTQTSKSSYVWVIPAGGSLTSGGTSTSNTATITWDTEGSKALTVNYTDANGCTAATATTSSITVKPLPQPLTVDDERCGAGTLTLTSGSTITGSSLVWYDGATQVGTGESYTTPSLTATKTYSVKATKDGCTGSSSNVTATIKTQPNTPVITPDKAYACGRESITFTASNVTAGSTLNWTLNSSDTKTGTTISYNLPAGTNTVQVVATIETCSAPQSLSIVGRDLPTIPSANDVSRVDAGSVTITPLCNPEDEVRWYLDGGAEIIATGSSYSPTITETTVYEMEASDNYCLSVRSRVTATVVPLSFSVGVSGLPNQGTMSDPFMLGGEANQNSIQMTCNANWQLQYKPDWVTVDKTTGTGNDVITMSYPASVNQNPLRGGYLRFTAGTTGDKELFFRQNTKTFAASFVESEFATIETGDPDVDISLSPPSNSLAFAINTDIANDYQVEITDATGENWMYKTVPSASENKLYLDYATNRDVNPRTGTLSFMYGDIVMQQFEVEQKAVTAWGTQTFDRNFVQTTAYGENGRVLGQSIAYSDNLGKSVQSVARNMSQEGLIVSQTLYDAFGRPEASTMPIPVAEQKLDEVPGFATPLTDYDYQQGIITWEPMPEDLVLSYYSNTNTKEPYVPHDETPYSRVEYSTTIPGAVRKSYMAGDATFEKYTIGFTVNASPDELFYVAVSSKINLDKFATQVAEPYKGNEFQGMAKTVSRDVMGKESVTYTDARGQVIATCMSGTSGAEDITATYKINSLLNPEGNYIDIHLPNNRSSYLIEKATSFYHEVVNLVDDEPVTSGTSQAITLVPGFYRIFTTSPTEVEFDVTTGYKYYSFNAYDGAGRLTKSLSPKDVEELSVYAGADLTQQLNDRVSRNTYNTLGWLLSSYSQDKGLTEYIYRRDGKIRFSQNEQQRTDNKFSYTNYDKHGRIVEVGEFDDSQTGTTYFLQSGFVGGQSLTEYIEKVYAAGEYGMEPNTNIIPASTYLDQTFTLYDKADPNGPGNPKFLRGKVAKTWNNNTATRYSYTYDGLVEWVVQEIKGMDVDNDGITNDLVASSGIEDADDLAYLDYTYDYNGNVTEVTYSSGIERLLPGLEGENQYARDYEFTHYYQYDLNDRLEAVYTQNKKDSRKLQARYFYYPHGPLKRVELADNLQGTDYVYTIQGWLKSINHCNMDTYDPGKDGSTGKNSGFMPDYFALELDYYSGDYTRTGSNIQASATQNNYDGNIARQRWRNSYFDSGLIDNTQRAWSYSYDERNYLASVLYGTYYYNYYNTGLFTAASNGAYSVYGSTAGSNIVYDANGNIINLSRKGANGELIDAFTYTYYNGLNQLEYIIDNSVYTLEGTTDLKAQGHTNYLYNHIGQMTANKQDGHYFTYDVYGKTKTIYNNISFASGTELATYEYDDRGFRVKKTDYNTNTTTYYVRDVSGNMIATYTRENTATLQRTEVPVYGSGRLGMATCNATGAITAYTYELTDHLGNVRATVGKNATNGTTQLLTATDYFPFGMEMPGRTYRSTSAYRFGYQGQFAEKDQETGYNQFEARLYDGRIGRWLNPDPDGQHWSLYLGMGNNPVMGVDPDGQWVWGAGFWNNIFHSDERIHSERLAAFANLQGIGTFYKADTYNGDWGVVSSTNWTSNGSILGKFLSFTPVGDDGELGPTTGDFYEASLATGACTPLYLTKYALPLPPIGLGLKWGIGAIGKFASRGLTFSEYKAIRGGTQTLMEISTSTGTQRISSEFHHVFLTQRLQRAYNLPNWMINNRLNVWKLNTVQHSLIDSYRYNFLRAGFKSDVGWFGKYNWFTKF
jgi:RHS repeat-associated protein